MKAVAALSLLLASASAFTPAQQLAAHKPLAASALDDEFGVSVETGFKCPPLGARILEDTQPAALKWFQNAEIKNGRVAMVATIGFMVQKMGLHFPLYFGPSGSNCFSPESTDSWFLSSSSGVTFSDVANAAPLDAIKMVPAAGWVQILFVAGWFESIGWERQWNEGRPVAGDYGYDPLGFTKVPGGLESPQMKDLRMKEIKNGRVAMMTMAGWISSELVPGSFPLWHP